jgi:hypothetical protein
MNEAVVARLNGRCRICGMDDAGRQLVNKAIWPAGMMGPRSPGYRVEGVKAALESATRVDPKSIRTHADHVEASWRHPTPAAPPTGTEVELFDVSLDGMTDRAAQLGARAMAEIDRAMPMMDPKDLVQVAKMGVGAVEKRENLRIKDRRPNISLLAVFGLVSGHIPETARIEDQHPVELLEAELDLERRAYAVRSSDD